MAVISQSQQITTTSAKSKVVTQYIKAITGQIREIDGRSKYQIVLNDDDNIN